MPGGSRFARSWPLGQRRERSGADSSASSVPHSSRGLGHRPLKAEIIGSNPICGTNPSIHGRGRCCPLIPSRHRNMALLHSARPDPRTANGPAQVLFANSSDAPGPRPGGVPVPVEKKVDKTVDGTASVAASPPIQSAIIVGAKRSRRRLIGERQGTPSGMSHSEIVRRRRFRCDRAVSRADAEERVIGDSGCP